MLGGRGKEKVVGFGLDRSFLLPGLIFFWATQGPHHKLLL